MGEYALPHARISLPIEDDILSREQSPDTTMACKLRASLYHSWLSTARASPQRGM
jgi:hypothetical protein